MSTANAGKGQGLSCPQNQIEHARTQQQAPLHNCQNELMIE
jgi:hypothetical protein